MKVITNEKLIQRNRKIGQYTTIASLAILAGGLYLSFQTGSQTSITLSFLALLLGFGLSQVGIYFGNRWGRSPRPDQLIASNLKGLSEKFTLYNYSSPVPHLLVGPSGLWIIIPYHQNGQITYEKDRWRQHGGNMYMKVFAQNSIGRPDVEIAKQIGDIEKAIKSRGEPGVSTPEIHPLLVFTNEKAEINAENAPVPTIPLKKLKDYLRKRPADINMTPERQAVLEEELATG